MTKGGSEDRLSDLCDDLLRRILCVVSRRWGSLWRSSGAVNLAVEAYDYLNRRYHRTYSSYEEREEAAFLAQEAFVHAAKAALDAAEVSITRPEMHLRN